MYAVMRYSKKYDEWVMVQRKWSASFSGQAGKKGFVRKAVAYKHLQQLRQMYPKQIFKVSTTHVPCLNCQQLEYRKNLDFFELCLKCRTEIEKEIDEYALS